MARLPTVLLVDDDESILDPLSMVLADEGFSILAAHDAAEALGLLADGARPDAIVSDIMMPGMDGYALRGRLLEDPELAAIPTVFVTAAPIDHRIRQMRLAGCLRKPVDLAALLGLLWRHIGGGEALSGHDVVLYQDQARLADRVADFVGAALAADGAALICATPDRHAQLHARLGDLGGRGHAGRIVALDAGRTLEAIRMDRRVSRHRFDRVVGDVVRQTIGSGDRPVHIYGEMVDLLWQSGETEAAFELEVHWNRLRRAHGFPLLCAYRTAGVVASLRPACDQHASCVAV